MGDLSSTLNEYRDISREYYEKIRLILEEEYCWKCPQRSTSSQIACKEVDAWVRLIKALEEGIKDSWFIEGYNTTNRDVINAKFMEKTHLKSKNHRTVIIKMAEDVQPYCKKGEYVIINENFSNIKKNDLVLITQICPAAKYFYLKMNFIDLPFKIDKVKRVFHENCVKYIESSDGSKIIFHDVVGIIINIISKKDPIFKELKLK